MCIAYQSTTPDEEVSLINRCFKNEILCGWSTHVNPDDTLPIAIAFSKGARMFENMLA